MASNPPEGYPDDFIERLLSMPSYPCDGGTTATSTLGNDERIGAATTATSSAVSQLSSGDEPIAFSVSGARGGGMFPLDLSLASPDGSMQFRPEIANGRAAGGGSVNIEGHFVPLANLIPAFGHMQPHSAQPTESQIHQVFRGQTTTGAVGSVQNPSTVRPKVRARRGQATDPHSIAERLRRERITERVKALQELVPSCSKTDRAAMLDEILDYVKFLRLQVKVLSMSRLGGAGAVAQLVADPQLSVLGDSVEVGNNQQPWDKWSSDGTEQEVAKLMEKDVGAAMQFLQSKALCIMPVSLASAIFSSQQQMDASSQVKPEPSAP